MLRITKGCNLHYTRRQNFCWAKEMTAHHRIKCVSEINLEYATTFCSLQFFEGYFCGVDYFLGFFLTANPNWFAPSNPNASTAASFAMHLAARCQITSPTSIGLMSVFFQFKAVNVFNVALQKVEVTKLGTWPLPDKFTNLVKEFIACLGGLEFEQLIAWRRCFGYILDYSAAVKIKKDQSCKKIFA